MDVVGETWRPSRWPAIRTEPPARFLHALASLLFLLCSLFLFFDGGLGLPWAAAAVTGTVATRAAAAFTSPTPRYQQTQGARGVRDAEVAHVERPRSFAGREPECRSTIATVPLIFA